DLGEEGAWTLYAEFGNLLDNGPNLGADKYRLEMRDPLFTLNFWGRGYELSERKSPFDFIVVSKDPSRGARLESGPVWVDIREEEGSSTYVFLEESFGDITVGAAARVNNQSNP